MENSNNMTQTDCSPNFLFNLSAVLAHTIWFEQKQWALVRGVDDARMGGDPPAPTASETTAAQLQAFTEYLPGLFQVLRPEQALSEQANVDLQRGIQPQLADLNLELLQKYGPEYNKVGADLARENQQLQAANDLSILQGTGRDVVTAAAEAQRLADPEYYAAREATNKKYIDLINSYDPTGLSPTEAANIERLTNRSNTRSGTAGLGSPTSAIANAFAFDDKLQQKKQNLSNVLSQYQGLQAGNRSGVDAGSLTTGKPFVTAFNQNQFQPVQAFGNASSQTSGTANNFLAQTGENARQTNDINAQRRDTLDRVNETQQAVGSWLSL
jgi:hypothetical protein